MGRNLPFIALCVVFALYSLLSSGSRMENKYAPPRNRHRCTRFIKSPETLSSPQKTMGSTDTTVSGVAKGTVTCLSGRRAVAITAGLFAHIGFRQNLGHLGVTLFFVISGFLITLLMLRENERTGTLNLFDFYRRRTLRIVPALSFFLLMVFLLQAAGRLFIAPKYWLAALTYTMCYVNGGNAHPETACNIAHTWSLSVEEHFYLLWPVLLLYAKPKTAYKTLLVYLLLVPLLRFIIARYSARHSGKRRIPDTNGQYRRGLHRRLCRI